jgi:molybdenum cofactor synthesis domain-containing protein
MKFNLFKTLISFSEAKEILGNNISAIQKHEYVSLFDASGRVAAEDVFSSADVPHFRRSAMDGYAVISKETLNASRSSPVTLKLTGNIHAGDAHQASLTEGTCIQVATGAKIPEGADAVVMAENTREHGDNVIIFKEIHPWDFIIEKGSDIKTGDKVINHGQTVNPAIIGALSAIGMSQVRVLKKPAVSVFTTGNEIVSAGELLTDGKTRDVNTHTLFALIEENGCIPAACPVIQDKEDQIIQNLSQAAEASDLIVVSGASSVGERDLLPVILQEKGKLLFHGIAMKPGKPCLFAIYKDIPVIGMPGNPASCLMNGYTVLAPVLRILAGLPEPARTVKKIPVAKQITSESGRFHFVPVRIEDNHAKPVFKGSQAISSMYQAHGYIEIPENIREIEKGEIVEVVMF